MCCLSALFHHGQKGNNRQIGAAKSIPSWSNDVEHEGDLSAYRSGESTVRPPSPELSATIVAAAVTGGKV
jgi:hypothetical protein